MGMHPVSTCVRRVDNKVIPQIKKVLQVKGHLWAETLQRCDPGDLNVLSTDVLDVLSTNVLINSPIRVLLRQ